MWTEKARYQDVGVDDRSLWTLAAGASLVEDQFAAASLSQTVDLALMHDQPFAGCAQKHAGIHGRQRLVPATGRFPAFISAFL